MKILVGVFVSLLVLCAVLSGWGFALAGEDLGQGDSLAEARKVLEQPLISMPETYDVPFYVSQTVAYTEIVATDHSVTITLTVTEK